MIKSGIAITKFKNLQTNLTLMIVTIIIANLLTYFTFRNYRKNTDANKSKLDKALIYVIIYLYVVLYSMFISYFSKWLLQVTGSLKSNFDPTNALQVIDQNIIDIVQNIVFTIPVFVVVSYITHLFNTSLLFNSANYYSPYYQLYVTIACILSLITFKQRVKEGFNISNDRIIQSFFIFVTVLTFLKSTVPDTSFGLISIIEDITNNMLRIFLNFKWEYLLIILPFIIFIGGITITYLDIPMDKQLKILLLFVGIFSIFLTIALIVKYTKNLKSVKTFKSILQNNPSLNTTLKWLRFILAYSLPLFVFTRLNNGNIRNLFYEFKSTLLNKKFLVLLLITLRTLTILPRYIAVEDTVIKQLTSVLLLTSVIVSKY